MYPKELVAELMPVIKSSHFLWLLLQPLFFFLYFPLWILGIYEYNILLKNNWQWLVLSWVIYFLIFYLLYSAYVVCFRWEDGMNDLFRRTVFFIIVGMVIWTVISFQGAY